MKRYKYGQDLIRLIQFPEFAAILQEQGLEVFAVLRTDDENALHVIWRKPVSESEFREIFEDADKHYASYP